MTGAYGCLEGRQFSWHSQVGVSRIPSSQHKKAAVHIPCKTYFTRPTTDTLQRSLCPAVQPVQLGDIPWQVSIDSEWQPLGSKTSLVRVCLDPFSLHYEVIFGLHRSNLLVRLS